MENLSVTIRHPEGKAAGGVLIGGGLLAGALTAFLPAGDPLLGFAIAGTALILGGVFLRSARRTETLDDRGICIRTARGEMRYPWQSVERVTVLPDRGKYSPPTIGFRITGRRGTLEIDYTRRTLACVRHYYGEPDFDEWGRPPIMN